MTDEDQLFNGKSSFTDHSGNQMSKRQKLERQIDRQISEANHIESRDGVREVNGSVSYSISGAA